MRLPIKGEAKFSFTVKGYKSHKPLLFLLKYSILYISITSIEPLPIPIETNSESLRSAMRGNVTNLIGVGSLFSIQKHLKI